MMLSSHGDNASSIGSSHGSALTVHSGHGRYEDAHKFSLEKLIDDAEAGDENAMKRLRRRRKYEHKLITKYNRTEIENKADDCWYLIDSRWLNKWYAFVRGGENMPPGLLSSRDLLDENNEPLPGLKAKIDYRGVAPMVFYVLCELHGRDSSPELCRYEVDIYARPLPTERIVKIAHQAAVKARIQVSKLRPKWLKWEREYPDDEEDEDRGCCCGLTKEHLEAFIYWMVACWSRRSSGRASISYRQYQPLRGLDDDPSNHSSRNSQHGNNDNNNMDGSSRGPGRLSMEMSQHGSTRQGLGGDSQHDANSNTNGSISLHGSSSVHGDTSTHSNVEWIWGVVTNPLNFSQHGSRPGSRSNSVHGNSSEDGDIESAKKAVEDDDSDSDSDIDDGPHRFSVAPADVGHESGTWLRSPFGS